MIADLRAGNRISQSKHQVLAARLQIIWQRLAKETALTKRRHHDRKSRPKSLSWFLKEKHDWNRLDFGDGRPRRSCC